MTDLPDRSDAIEELDRVTTLVDKPDIPVFTNGTVVGIWADGKAYEVEFSGDRLATYGADEIEPIEYDPAFVAKIKESAANPRPERLTGDELMVWVKECLATGTPMSVTGLTREEAREKLLGDGTIKTINATNWSKEEMAAFLDQATKKQFVTDATIAAVAMAKDDTAAVNTAGMSDEEFFELLDQSVRAGKDD